MKLYRPTGISELELIYDSGMKSFPARLLDQPVFYPVTNFGYATQIAKDWNKPRPPSYCGFVVSFEISDLVLKNYDSKIVGNSYHKEFWIPSDHLPSFNSHLLGQINLIEGHFSENYNGYIGESRPFEPELSLTGKSSREQIQIIRDCDKFESNRLSKLIDQNRKFVFLNILGWKYHGLESKFLKSIITEWNKLGTGIHLPESEKDIDD